MIIGEKIVRGIKAAAFGAMLLLAVSCNLVQDLLHDEDVVARVGKQKLYRSEVLKFLPSDVHGADSTNLCLQYINSWAAEQIFHDMAILELPKEDQDVTQELEAYKRSLLRYRYEQRYINDRLDTVITDDQMRQYYDAHQSQFLLERPVLKVRFVDIHKTAQNKDAILKMMASNRPADVLEAERMASESAIRYFDSSDEWMDAASLSREFGMDYGTMLSRISNGFIMVESDDRSDIMAAYIREIKRSGTAPFDYCFSEIREYILSARKRALLDDLERNLLTESFKREKFVIY